jgi:hypothetical protein
MWTSPANQSAGFLRVSLLLRVSFMRSPSFAGYRLGYPNAWPGSMEKFPADMLAPDLDEHLLERGAVPAPR